MNKDLKSFFIIVSSSLLLLFLLSSIFAYNYFNLSSFLSSNEQTQLFMGGLSTFFLILLILFLFAKKFLFPILELNTLVLAQKTNTLYEGSLNFFNDEISSINEHIHNLKKEVDEDSSAIEKLSLIDPLTGIHNRHYFFEFGERIFKLSKRNKEELSVVVFEIDDFEYMIEKYGQKTGDDTLALLCKETQQFLRKSDIFARYGTRELIIMLPKTTYEEALLVSKKIQSHLDTPNFKHHSQVYISVSIGISSLKEGDILLRDIVTRSISKLIETKETVIV